MELFDKTILIIGGFGLVGQAIARRLLAGDHREAVLAGDGRPRRIVVHSLRREEAEAAVQALKRPGSEVDLIAEWGDVLALSAYKDAPRTEVLRNRSSRRHVAASLLNPLSGGDREKYYLYELIERYRPAAVIDGINTATAIAYADIYRMTERLRNLVEGSPVNSSEESSELLEEVLASAYLPLLIRHTQVLYAAMKTVGTEAYIKIGTSGTGGMGFNIPYTHSEEKPSAALLTKSAVAGAHTMLLFLLSRTPDAPALVKEIKPAAAIAWKKIGFGPILKRGQHIARFDTGTAGKVSLDQVSSLVGVMDTDGFKRLAPALENVFIDTGETGLFSLDEFSALTTSDQMQFVTPEEIAELVVRELRGGSTGHDVIDAMDHAVLTGSYRAGLMRHWALKELKSLEELHDVRSVAFENLGPPRLAKLLFEAEILRQLADGTATWVLEKKAEDLSQMAEALINGDSDLRTDILSIGLAIILEGGTLLRGPEISVLREGSDNVITPNSIDSWAERGWVDLRKENMEEWQKRFKFILKEVEAIPVADSSSHHLRSASFWGRDLQILPGKIAGWIFTREGGERLAGT